MSLKDEIAKLKRVPSYDSNSIEIEEVGKTQFEKVKDFHRKFKLPIPRVPQLASDESAILKLRLISEEFAELIKAMNCKDIIEIADALADQIYVINGCAIGYGINLDTVFDEVHKSNMTKTLDTDVGGKVQKGSDFVPPDIETALMRGFRDIE